MNKPFKIVILGGGTAGWMAANLFANRWSKTKAEVTLIESPDIGIVGVGEGSTPTLKRFFEIIGVKESQWMPQCNATYKVNIRFDNWSPGGNRDSYSHPFISQIDTFTERSFLVNCRTRRLGLDTTTEPEKFFINGVLARQGKGPITPDNFPFRMEYGYHFDSHLLGEFLSDVARRNGVRHIQAKVNQVETTDSGSIYRLNLDNGEVVVGDFFVDCSGFAGVLMEKTLNVPFSSYKDNLFNDSAVVMPTDIDKEVPVETVSTALSNGWCWKIPLTNRFGNGYVYSSSHISSDDAELELRKHLGCEDSEQQARHLKMRVGRLESQWSKNCVAIGLSQGFIEPLEATALHLTQICIEILMTSLEEGNFSNAQQDKYNTLVKERFDRIRDYIVAHYKLNTRNDSEYWRENRNNTNISDSLSSLLNVWFAREDLAAEITKQNIEDHFGAASWHCLFSGYGAYPPISSNQPGKGDLYLEKNIKTFIEGCSLNFTSHTQLLNALKN